MATERAPFIGQLQGPEGKEKEVIMQDKLEGQQSLLQCLRC